MQRLFSMFPEGAAGLALVVLRGCVIASLWICVASRESFVAAGWPMVGLALIGVLLAAGAFTPAVCFTCVAIELYSLWPRITGDLLHVVLAASLSVVLGLLGPGAFSIDAKLFGRRRIIPRQE
jgi:hypothetical protein